MSKIDLSVKYMGITLKNPVIVGANNMVGNIESLKQMEEAGASAIVYKSLFEEQLHMENLEYSNFIDEYVAQNSDETSPYPDLDVSGPKEYLFKLKKAKEVLNIPLFASLNAVYDVSWVDYAKQIEAIGIDGIELNFYTLPKEMESAEVDFVNWQFDIVEKIKAAVNIPVAVKLSSFYNNPLAVIKRMDNLGADAFVLFNRFFQPDIDLEKEEMIFPYNLSSKGDYGLALRFAGLLYNRIEADVCSSTGVFNGEDVAKLILAGADTVQVVSVMYKDGINKITDIMNELSEFMAKKGYENLDDFRGKLSQLRIDDTFAYSRAQYLDFLVNSVYLNDRV
ncbi:MAG: dihydroorotate dehydrogenase-like protein [Bacteroidales bacterium]|nr:dihydroorotate dehydrogenase-like protein [Bacteroidales bacterium]